MSGGGLRNWRGEIVQPAGGGAAAQDVVAADDNSSTAAGAPQSVDAATPNDQARESAVAKRQRAEPKKLFRKDEFGRDVEVASDDREDRRHGTSKHRRDDAKSEDKERKRKRKHKHKHERKRSRSRRSKSPAGRKASTPPPPDPFRPQLDERRHGRTPRRQDRRSPSASRDRGHRHYRGSRRSSPSRSASAKSSHSHSHSRRRGHRRSASRSRSRSPRRSRGYNRSRSRSRSPGAARRGHRRSAADAARKWTHDAFDERSPSPVRQTDPLYRPEPEAWVSRAGGVYVPRH